MIIWINRVFLLLSLIGIAFLFTRSEQFGTLESKVVSLDFSPDGKHLGVAMNHALWNYDEEYRKKLSNFSRRVNLIDLESDKKTVIHSELVPVDAEIDYLEWSRILGQRPNYDDEEAGLLPFSPIQFFASTNRLAYFNFENDAIETYDIDSGTTKFLITPRRKRANKKLTPGWFVIPPDGLSIIVEDEEFEIHRYRLDSDQLEVKLPLGEPFYMDSQNLSLGPFIDLRVLGGLREPRPIYGASRNPNEQELAVATVLQICFVNFDGKIPRILMSRRLEVGSTILYSPDGQLMAAIHRDVIRFFSDKMSIKAISNADKFVTAFAFSPDSTRFATGDNDGTIRVWDTKTFDLLSTHSFNLDWRVHWLLPFFAGFSWLLWFIATYGMKQKKKLID